MTKALAMMSGGLDSVLAAKIIKDQGIEVIGLCFKSYFFGESNAVRMAKQIDIPLEVVDFSKEHFEMVKNPPSGRGKNMNPCIDCHAMMMNYAGHLLEKFNADFIITGEVLGQRPMSQNKSALDRVKKISGFSDKILRPLCAKNLAPTEMENNGLVDREKLLDISGRSRKVQMELAEKYGIKDYPSPAGGCKLTEPNYSIRLKKALDINENIEEKSLNLLSYGRHFLLPDNKVIIISRTGDEGELIKGIIDSSDTVILPSNCSGAMGIVVGDISEEDAYIACRLVARYSKQKDSDAVLIKYGKFKTKFSNEINVKPADQEMIDKYIIK